MSYRSLLIGTNPLTEGFSRNAQTWSELPIADQLLENPGNTLDEPDPPADDSESPGDGLEVDSIFICGRCDMIIREDDKVCEFCGAQFEDADAELVGFESSPLIDRPLGDNNDIEQAAAPSHPARGRAIPCVASAEKVDVLSMFEDNRSKLGYEHMAGGASGHFLTYARMLRSIESAISEAGEFGIDTGEAGVMLLAAWKACHEGEWSRAKELADGSRKLLAPSVTNLVNGQLSCLREAIVEMKRRGRSITPLVIEIKLIQRELSEMRLDEAMRSTKAVISEIKKIQMHILDDIDSSELSAEFRTTFRGQGI